MITQTPSSTNPDALEPAAKSRSKQANLGAVDTVSVQKSTKSGNVSSRSANTIEAITPTGAGGMLGEG